MTLRDVVNQIYNISLGHFVNGEKFTKQRLTYQIRAMTRPETGSTAYIMEICLPDGRWYAEVEQYRPGEYDLYIPDTREQEEWLIDRYWRRYANDNMGEKVCKSNREDRRRTGTAGTSEGGTGNTEAVQDTEVKNTGAGTGGAEHGSHAELAEGFYL